MILFAWYLLKVLIVSAILCGYYYVSLRNKIFHRWNRFYLMLTVALSMLLPLISIDVFKAPAQEGTVIKVLQAVTVQDEIVIELGRQSLLTTDRLVIGGYILVSLFFVATLILTLVRIYRIRRAYPHTEVEGINFINTDEKGTPFSFFNSIFWNRSIDLHTTAGQQIFNHEIAHIKEKHTYDKIFMNVVLLFFWINPFFWLIRKELNMIHEFIADKTALENGNVNDFAEMIISSIYPNQQFSIANNFFYSPIKRRLKMLIKNKNSKVTYVSRLLVLPLAAIVFMAFAIKMRKAEPAHIYDGQKINVIIDAGHGGADAGAISQDFNEKDLTLAISKQIKELNSNKHINIILSRNHDEYISVQDRVNFAIEKNADLFVSIHINSEGAVPQPSDGLNLIIPKNDNAYLGESKLLGSSIIQSFKKADGLKISHELLQKKVNSWVLKENKYPAVIIEAGYMTSQKDLNYLLNTDNQQVVAKNILNGIENYAQSIAKSSMNIRDTIPEMYYQDKKITEVQVRPSKDNIKITYADGTTETITEEEANKRGIKLPPPPPPPAPPASSHAPNAPNVPNASATPAPPPPPTAPAPPNLTLSENALYLLDGKEIGAEELVPANQIVSISILKKSDNIYGEKGRNGVVEIFTKNEIKDTIPDKIFTKVEQEAQFPGGQNAWVNYITGQVMASQDSIGNNDFGTCIVKFIVTKDGSVSNVEATTMKGSQLAKIAVAAIRKGPKWQPAMQNGHKVNAYRLQPVTLTNPGK